MNKELDYLITLCRAYIYKNAVSLDSGIDYNKLYKISNKHNLSAVVFCVINTSENKDIVPSDAFKLFESDFFEAVIRYDIQDKVLHELDKLLSDNGIRHIFFKGAQIKEYYPVPQARVMGDIDLLIDFNNRDRVKKILPENGFELVNSNGPVYDYSKDNIKIEMHTKIISGKVGNSDAEVCFADAINHGRFSGFCGSLDADYHFAYLIAHLAHHFWFYGAGVKLILDLAVMQLQFDINLDNVFERLREMRLEKFSRVILSVCYKWFGTGKSFDENTEETERFLLTYGAFGNINRNRAAVIERKELEQGRTSSPLKTRLRLLFPSYNTLKNIPYIKFIEGRPYLLPYAWIYRITYNFKHKRAYVKAVTYKIGSDEANSEAEKEFAYFKEIGLL